MRFCQFNLPILIWLERKSNNSRHRTLQTTHLTEQPEAAPQNLPFPDWGPKVQIFHVHSGTPRSLNSVVFHWDISQYIPLIRGETANLPTRNRSFRQRLSVQRSPSRSLKTSACFAPAGALHVQPCFTAFQGLPLNMQRHEVWWFLAEHVPAVPVFNHSNMRISTNKMRVLNL